MTDPLIGEIGIVAAFWLTVGSQRHAITSRSFLAFV